MELAYFLMNNVDCLSLFHECSLGEGSKSVFKLCILSIKNIYLLHKCSNNKYSLNKIKHYDLPSCDDTLIHLPDFLNTRYII